MNDHMRTNNDNVGYWDSLIASPSVVPGRISLTQMERVFERLATENGLTLRQAENSPEFFIKFCKQYFGDDE